MAEIGELMALFLQEREEERDRGGGAAAARTIIDLLRDRRMDGGVDRLRRRKSLQERLGLKGIGCCGSTWGFGPSTVSIRADNEEDDTIADSLHQQIDETDANRTPEVTNSVPDCVFASPRMNLAAALAAERHFRSAEDGGETLTDDDNDNDNRIITTTAATNSTPPRGSTVTAEHKTPLRVSLLRLLEESDGQDEKDLVQEKEGTDLMCCVCMGRKKGAAFIPCGHTFCRVCSRELWLNRGACPLCNRSILEILDIY